MLCPEGELTETAIKPDEEKFKETHINDVHAEGVESLELNTFKNSKTWKKSISEFFHQLRSTKSNDGDHAASGHEEYKDKEFSPEQKWQSLGKIFRRTSIGPNSWNKCGNQLGESSSHGKKMSVKKVLSSYFGKSQKNFKTTPLPDED